MSIFRTASAIALLFTAAALHAAPAYTLVDLGDRVASAINSDGHILGTSAYGFDPLIWRDGRWHRLDDKYTIETMHAIGNHDIAAGSEYDFGGGTHAVMWTRSGHVVDLSLQLPGNSRSEATGVAADGTVAGWYQVAGEELHAFVVKHGVLKTVACPARTTGCTVLGVSPNGIAAGTLDKSTRRPAALWRHGQWHDIGAFDGGLQASANAVNRLGHAVGWSMRNGNEDMAAMYYADGVMVDLGQGHIESRALAINADDTVVGLEWVDVGSQETARGFVWQGGERWWLDDVIVDLPAGWSILQATGINDMGWIVGQALEDVGGGKTKGHAVLLKPVAR
jgi:probable HAF family extracellular repeat protein